MSSDVTACVLIGRFQPFHTGHLALLREALRRGVHCVVVVGSAGAAPSPKNPWSFDERRALILAAVTTEERARLSIVPLRDYFNEARWAAAAQRAVQAALRQAGFPTANMALVGHFKDASSSYLRAFPGWSLVSLPRQGDVDAVQIRAALWQTPQAARAALHALNASMPASTLHFLDQWLGSPAHALQCTEQQALVKHWHSWQSAPYPPVFVTVDTVVTCQRQVLLIQRGRPPGAGRLALPGGYLDQHETLYHAALRELHEETALPVDASLETCVRGQHVFDHPGRSLLGRVITHVWHFELGERPLPAVKGGDDAKLARWVPFDELCALESQLHDDHFMILDHFLHLLPA